MTLTQLRAFVAVVDHGTIRAAARSLAMEQSGLTQQMKRLEAVLGATLFIRANKGIALTTQGEELLTRARVILSECDRTEQFFLQHNGEISGEVNVGFSSEVFSELVPPALRQLRQTHPGISVHFASGPSTLLLSGIREGRLDFAVTLVSKSVDMSDLQSTFIGKSDPCVVARMGHPKRKATRLEELVDCEWVNTRRLGRVGTPSNRVADWFTANKLPQPRMVGSVESLFDTLSLVAKTDYLFLAPASVLENSALEPQLSRIDVEEPIPATDMCLVQRSSVPLAPAGAQFATMLLSYANLLQRHRANA